MQDPLNHEIEPEDASSDQIKEPFDPKKIDISTKQMILEVFFRRLRKSEIDMNTFFQRQADLWDRTKQSRLIESILINLPLPAFYFDGSDDNRWLVVDGLQRLSVFNNFVVHENFALENLEYLRNFDGCHFSELPRELQRRIEEHPVTVYIINPGTPEEVKFNLFSRINTGGLVLTPQEIRNALNQGVPVDFIRNLASLPEFKRFNIKTDRANDEDFITRFVAFYMQELDEYQQELEAFLSKSMKKISALSEGDRDEMRTNFASALDTIWEIFADDAFRKRYNEHDQRKPVNKSLFEAWSVVIARLDQGQQELLIRRKEDVKRRFVDALNTDKDFEKSITSGTGKVAMVTKRHRTLKSLVEHVLNDQQGRN